MSQSIASSPSTTSPPQTPADERSCELLYHRQRERSRGRIRTHRQPRRGLAISPRLRSLVAGKLVVIGSHGAKPTFSFHSFDQVMGVAVGKDRLAVGSRRQIHFLRAAHEVAPTLPPSGSFDGCFLSRTSFTTGSIHGHDLAFGSEGLWVVNTLFSCLCTLDGEYNFFPRWRPPFVSQLIDQNRCHLNGMAIENGTPRYVTVLGLTDEPAGWRNNKRSGGAILDVPSGEVVSSGLCMPHSPRVHAGKLWVLNSGCGELSIVDTKTGKLQVVASLPGYTRGLAFLGNYAFVGLSRIRETNVFGGLPIGEHPDQLHCGLGIVEITTGRTIATLRFKTGVEELFAVEIIPGCFHPKIVGPSPVPGDEDEVWIVPPLDRHTMESTESPLQPVTTPSVTIPPNHVAQRVALLVEQSDAAHVAGQLETAFERLQEALNLTPDSADLLNRAGNLQQDTGNQIAALESYQQAVQANPNFAPAHQNLGVLWIVNNQPMRALKHFELAQQSAPQPMNLVLAAKTLPVIYDSSEQLAYWRGRYSQCVAALVSDGVQIDTTQALADTSFYLAYQGENDRDIMANLGKVYRGVECPQASRNRRPKGRKIRVGFVSAYFRDHTIGRLNLGRIRGLSRDAFEVVVVSLGRPTHDMALSFRSAADQYVTVPRNVGTARQTIADLEVDVLVFADIGMDALTQSLCYSRMAPIQAVTWGHPDTTGSPTIDYFVSSALAETPEAQSHYTERLERLPNLGVYYERPQLTGSKRTKESFGLSHNKHTYLCPQTSFKFHPMFDEALRGILESDPNGELVVLEGRVAPWTEALKRRWERVLPDGIRRVKFLKTLSQPDFLHLLASADVLLDPFPFCGGNSSYEAFAVGSPVVTYPSPFLRGRLTAAMYRRMGLESLVSQNVKQYVDAAVALGTDRDHNRAVRKAIESQSGVLFEHQDEITSWELVLRKWVEETL
jgi:protein O-GlcNAc transferase